MTQRGAGPKHPRLLWSALRMLALRMLALRLLALVVWLFKRATLPLQTGFAKGAAMPVSTASALSTIATSMCRTLLLANILSLVISLGRTVLCNQKRRVWFFELRMELGRGFLGGVCILGTLVRDLAFAKVRLRKLLMANHGQARKRSMQ